MHFGGPLQVTVLEVRDRLGGRVHTHTLTAPDGQSAQVLNCRLLASSGNRALTCALQQPEIVCCAATYTAVAGRTFTCHLRCHAIRSRQQAYECDPFSDPFVR